MGGPIDVAFCFDDHLALPGAVTLLSLAKTNPGVRIHVMADPGTRCRPLVEAVAAAHGATVQVLEQAPEAAELLNPHGAYGGYSTATYRRLFLPRLLPDLDRVLYLDSDMIVRGDLRALWETELGGAAIAAVPDAWATTVAPMRDRFPQGYFNSGTLVMDLAEWRRRGVARACLDYLASAPPDPYQFWDQTPLNEVLRGGWHRVSPRWNFMTLYSPQLADQLGIAADDYAEIAADPAIVHFLAAYKPWISGFERLGRFYAEWHAVRQELVARFDTAGLDWPGSYINSRQAAMERRMMALRLVVGARARGFERPTVLLTGLLGHEVALVAREQGYAINGFASEYSAVHGGQLLDLPVLGIDQALDQGARTFIIGDYRRLDRTRATLAHAAAARDIAIRTIDPGGGRLAA